jgi:tetratricopeptide (TPR) repeat protein
VTEQQGVGAATGSTRGVPEVWGNVPQRNKNFTGRESLLTDLRQRVTGDLTAVLAHALHGMGGVGKTMLAVEYAYRYMGDYQLVWWISADQLGLVRSSLAALAPRLGIEDPAPNRTEAVDAVLDALRRGEPFDRWLLVFDNADQPEEIFDLIPSGTGHVIVTSRNHRWQNQADTVEVDVFSRQESLDFLKRRVPGIKPEESIRLAEELGDLPLALEQASALQIESGITVDDYLEQLAIAASKVLSETAPADYPIGVPAAWSLSMERVKEQSPLAWELLCRCAFFGPEPIHQDVFKQGRYVLGPPLGSQVADPIMLGRAIRELGRYSLARVDNLHRTLQVHRLIQRLIREDIDADQTAMMQHEVHLLLAAADPDGPEETENVVRYDELLAHLVPSGVVRCDQRDGRRLIRNMVHYLYWVGDLWTCDALSSEALEAWTADSGPDDIDVLILSGQRADLLWTQGNYPGAYQLRSATLERMRAALGEDHEATLEVLNGFGADLRARGEFSQALELDERTLERHNAVFGVDDRRTFNVVNNLAVDQQLNGDYDAAFYTDSRTHQDRLDFYGRDDHRNVIHSLGSVARDLRQAGRYKEALPIAEQAYRAFAELIRQGTLRKDHVLVLIQAKDLSVVRRKMGLLEPALELAEGIYGQYVGSYGANDPNTLAAAMNLGNARRVYSDVVSHDPELLALADEQVEATFGRYGEVLGEDHPYTHGCALNLAIVRRRANPESARELLENALEGLRLKLTGGHHYTLTCMTALATSMADTGDLDEARRLGEEALTGLRNLLGLDHPHTLACASNLAIDLRALGKVQTSEELAKDTVARYRRVLSDDHFDVTDAMEGQRIALDFEPPAL